MSYRDVIANSKAFERLLKGFESRISAGERGDWLRGEQRFDSSIQIGDVLYTQEVQADSSIVVSATNLLTGTKTVIHTIP